MVSEARGKMKIKTARQQDALFGVRRVPYICEREIQNTTEVNKKIIMAPTQAKNEIIIDIPWISRRILR
jgi:hypothetical protein